MKWTKASANIRHQKQKQQQQQHQSIRRDRNSETQTKIHQLFLREKAASPRLIKRKQIVITWPPVLFPSFARFVVLFETSSGAHTHNGTQPLVHNTTTRTKKQKKKKTTQQKHHKFLHCSKIKRSIQLNYHSSRSLFRHHILEWVALNWCE